MAARGAVQGLTALEVVVVVVAIVAAVQHKKMLAVAAVA
jgi:hypothetical protein